jgi:AraC-like DNA-binding protein
MTNNLLNLILYIADIVININFLLITIFLFFLKKGNRRANKVLATIIIFIIIQNAFYAFYAEKKVFYYFPHLIKIHLPFLFAIPPTFYFYFKILFFKNFKIRLVHGLHYLPSLAVIVFFIPFFILSANDKIAWIQKGDFGYHYILGGIFYLQFLIYVPVIIYQLKKYSRAVKDIDYISVETRQWMKELLILLIIFLIITIIPVFISFKIQSLLYVPILNSVVYFYIIYKVFFRSEIFLNLQTIQESIIDNKKHQNTNLAETEIDNIHQKLIKFLYKTEIYLEHNISLPLIAEKLDVSYHTLSHTINKKNNQNFNDFINQKRIEEAKKRLCDSNYNNLTIEAIGKSVGFNSKITFYTAFKKQLNITPAQYKKLYQV